MGAAKAKLVEQLVFTADQAAAVLGLARQSVIDSAKRRRANGRPISWDRGEEGNRLNHVLVLASWVYDQAAGRDGEQAVEIPMKICLPMLPGMRAARPELPHAPSDLSARLAEAELLAESYRSEATEERMARLEAEADAARSEAAAARAEADRLREALTALVSKKTSPPS